MAAKQVTGTATNETVTVLLQGGMYRHRNNENENSNNEGEW